MNLLSQPLPTSISAFKNHPLFALRRHVLKYEAIYPPDTQSLGFIKGEEVLPRSSVHILHTREKWLQSVSLFIDYRYRTFSFTSDKIFLRYFVKIRNRVPDIKMSCQIS